MNVAFKINNVRSAITHLKLYALNVLKIESCIIKYASHVLPIAKFVMKSNA
jgi:hypothetical protein